jgi:hypothetical protein
MPGGQRIDLYQLLKNGRPQRAPKQGTARYCGAAIQGRPQQFS